MFETLAKIANVRELRGKLVATGLLLVVFRLGKFIPTPGINVRELTDAIESQSGPLGSVLSMADMFTDRKSTRLNSSHYS